MNIFKWMQNRLNGTNGKMKPSSISATHHMLNETYKQEFSDWDHAILAIGTLGNNNLNENSNKSIDEEDSHSFQDFTHEFSFEEVGNFQNELKMNLEESGNFYPSNNLICNRGRESLDKSNKNEVSNQSLSFLLKKIFVCGGELPPTSVFKDPLSTESRMEKILRAILHKKIHPHGSCSTTFVNKYLENNSKPEYDYEDEDEDEYEYEYEEELKNSVVEKGCKWVKTNSEYIVLEI